MNEILLVNLFTISRFSRKKQTFSLFLFCIDFGFIESILYKTKHWYIREKERERKKQVVVFAVEIINKRRSENTREIMGSGDESLTV
jgi:hypothetical protein